MTNAAATTILLLLLTASALAEFRYDDFNQTRGLVFNGHAKTSDCGEKNVIATFSSSFLQQLQQPDNSTGPPGADSNSSTVVFLERSEVGGVQSRRTVETNEEGEYSTNLKHREAMFGHRHAYLPSVTTGCPTRLRLTESYQSQTGSVWYEKRLPVLGGFETSFSFQITDHSRTCSDHVDPSLAHGRRHRSCAVHGGDGFAFVLHADGRDTAAIGKDGEDLGYGGLNNSLAVEFDLWTNAPTQQQSDDFHEDHISIHSGSVGPNNPGNTTALGYASPAANLADANQNLLQYVKDNGEGRRLGTLAIFLDDGIDLNEPILVIPLNLSVLLNLPQGRAYAGFTGSTGLKWEKHDILSWIWCDEQCLSYEAS